MLWPDAILMTFQVSAFLIRSVKLPHGGSVSGDLMARTKGRTSPEAPWWSASGASPSTRRNVLLTHNSLVRRPRQAYLLRSNQSHQANPSRRGPHLPRRKRVSQSKLRTQGRATILGW